MDDEHRFWAHSANAAGERHDLREHLESVARLARQFAEPVGAGPASIYGMETNAAAERQML